MPKYDPHRYARHSFRVQGYDYTQQGMYFVTICTFQRECLLGVVENEKMVANQMGRIVEDEWLNTPILRSNVLLDTFVVMPNHFHGIIEITPADRGKARRAPTVERLGNLPKVVQVMVVVCGKIGWQLMQVAFRNTVGDLENLIPNRRMWPCFALSRRRPRSHTGRFLRLLPVHLHKAIITRASGRGNVRLPAPPPSPFPLP